MKTIISTIIIILLAGCTATPYAKIGLGYKFQESETVWYMNGIETPNHPISARGEAGFKIVEWSFGISHHSQLMEGWPFNNHGEYSKTEFFVDYKVTFSPISF
jgi:hypothetical protein